MSHSSISANRSTPSKGVDNIYPESEDLNNKRACSQTYMNIQLVSGPFHIIASLRQAQGTLPPTPDSRNPTPRCGFVRSRPDICPMPDFQHPPFYLELGAVVFNIFFLVFLIREKRVCWIYGIVASLLSVALFLSMDKPLYSESVLYVFYAGFGVYGWINWSTSTEQEISIMEWGMREHVKAFLVGAIGMVGLGYFFSTRTDADVPYADAFSTSFSFVATYMEANKILSGWIYWIVLNGFTIWLYAYKSAFLYSGLMVAFAVMSIVGYMSWRRKFRNQT